MTGKKGGRINWKSTLWEAISSQTTHGAEEEDITQNYGLKKSGKYSPSDSSR